jgi:hypothetical protein
MNAQSRSPAPGPSAGQTTSATPRPEVRAKVKELLLKTPAFARLPPDARRDLAHNMTLIADYLAAPEGVAGNHLAGGLGPKPAARTMEEDRSEAQWKRDNDAVAEIGKAQFDASAAMAAARAAGEFMNQVKFVDFVSGLIDGVFNSIVGSSIKQMEAYAQLVQNVAMSLNRFRDENVSENQGRDQMVDQFPDVFEIGKGDDFGDQAGPRLKLKEGVDEGAALARVQQGLGPEGAAIKSIDVSDEEVERRLVLAGRNQMATSRQQLLATLVMMGISRIVVTDGRISAKVVYDFQARDNRRLQRSAEASDYARDKDGQLSTTWSGEGEYDSGGDSSRKASSNKGDWDDERNANWYAKGKYKYAQTPVMTARSMANEMQDSQLSVKAQLAGTVDVNFKSDYLPLEKMATPGMMAAIQMNSKPVDPNVVPGLAPGSAPAGGQAAPATAPAAAPAK